MRSIMMRFLAILSQRLTKALPLLLGDLLLTGCGYRAPLYKSYIPVVKDSTLYPRVRAGYKQLAALAAKASFS